MLFGLNGDFYTSIGVLHFECSWGCLLMLWYILSIWKFPLFNYTVPLQNMANHLVKVTVDCQMV